MNRTAMILIMGLAALSISPQEHKTPYGGMLYLSSINDTRVNIRDYPSLSGSRIGQLNTGDKVAVTGISATTDKIDGTEGYWLEVQQIVGSDELGKSLGWVYSKYVKGGQNLKAISLKFESFVESTAKRAAMLKVSYDLGGQTRICEVYPNKVEGQDFYSFAWANDDQNFDYRTIPGSYVWYPTTNEIKHISYIGATQESAWVEFTDDFKFEFEDFGTAPGPRALSVWNLQTKKKVFSGDYYDDLKIKGHTIRVVYAYDNLDIDSNAGDKEIDAYAQKYLSQHPAPKQRSDGLTNTLLITCTLDLDANRRTIDGGEYIVTQ